MQRYSALSLKDEDKAINFPPPPLLLPPFLFFLVYASFWSVLLFILLFSLFLHSSFPKPSFHLTAPPNPFASSFFYLLLFLSIPRLHHFSIFLLALLLPQLLPSLLHIVKQTQSFYDLF